MQGTRGPYWIDGLAPEVGFPDVDLALRDPNGLLAVGGDLHPARLLAAYRHGIFPWFSDGQPILWWSPDPRMVLPPTEVRITRSLGQRLRRDDYEIRFDSAFAEVIHHCGKTRADAEGTWITPDMEQAYGRLHAQGHAHSIEAWMDGELVGGLYGVAVGRTFCGESMFSRARDASKLALVHLCRHLLGWGYDLIDCQVHTDHLASLGAGEISREDFIRQLRAGMAAPCPSGPWQAEAGWVRELREHGRLPLDPRGGDAV